MKVEAEIQDMFKFEFSKWYDGYRHNDWHQDLYAPTLEELREVVARYILSNEWLSGNIEVVRLYKVKMLVYDGDEGNYSFELPNSEQEIAETGGRYFLENEVYGKSKTYAAKREQECRLAEQKKEANRVRREEAERAEYERLKKKFQ